MDTLRNKYTLLSCRQDFVLYLRVYTPAWNCVIIGLIKQSVNQ